MNWTAIGAIGEILGALAVGATLGYLALQIRQTNKIARAESYGKVIDAHVGIGQICTVDTNLLVYAPPDVLEHIFSVDVA